jgi:hypothetical protein
MVSTINKTKNNIKLTTSNDDEEERPNDLTSSATNDDIFERAKNECFTSSSKSDDIIYEKAKNESPTSDAAAVDDIYENDKNESPAFDGDNKSSNSTVGNLTVSTSGSTDTETTAQSSPDSTNFITPQKSDGKTYTYEDLGLTPTKMCPLQDVLEQMKKDGIWSTETYNQQQNTDFRLIVFLYGKRYYEYLPSEERVACIKKCICPAGKNRNRLLDIVCSAEYDQVLEHGLGGFDAYVRFHSSVTMLFENKHAKGGFPSDILLRRQKSKNCYIVAACMYLTVKLQRDHPPPKDHPEQKQLPIDVGTVGRRYVIDTREGLEQRVIDNEGDNAMALVRKITNRCNFASVICDVTSIPKACVFGRHKHNLDLLLDANEPGLVTRFHTNSEFKKAAGIEPEGPGYVVFDGASIDTVGKFVPLDEVSPAKREELKTTWDKQVRLIAQQTKQHKENMKEFILQSPRGNHKIERQKEATVQNSKDESKLDSDAHGTHAMVMIGYLETGRWLTFKRRQQKRLYVLWNWWAKMPLVLVSFDYLVACQCDIYFSEPKLDKEMLNDARQPAALLACDCSFPDHSENSTYENISW